MGFTKKSFAVELSRLEVFKTPKEELEQYPTDSEIAADILWGSAMKGEIDGKTIADLGCGTGIFGIGSLLLGAKKVFFVDKDKDALTLAEKNLERIKGEYDLKKADAKFILSEIEDFGTKADAVFQNPPFGVKNKHADKKFLEAAFRASPLIYTLHKASTKRFVEAISKDRGFRITEEKRYDFPLKQTFSHHKKKVQKIGALCFRIEKKNQN